MVLAISKPPSISEQSFNCPHCGALAHQSWWTLSADRNEGGRPPIIKFPTNGTTSVQALQCADQEVIDAIDHFNKVNSRMPFIESSENGYFPTNRIYNLNISQCFSCGELAIWLHDRLIFPRRPLAIHASTDMPADIKLDFEEARQIFPQSAKGAAALLRLSIQKLCVELGEKGKKLDDDIASLVKKGLSAEVQQALDIVRVIGNEAVHPGQIDLNDDPSIAQTLFELVNFIVDDMISKPKKIKEMYHKLPRTKLEAIERRDPLKTSGK